MKKILITGASGFIGSNLLNHFKELGGYEIFYTGTDNENKVDGIKVGNRFQDINFNYLKDLDVLFHQAAITDTLVEDKHLMAHANTFDPIKLFVNALENGCKRIVYASSCAVYGDVNSPFKEAGPFNPLNEYARCKLCLDQLVFLRKDRNYEDARLTALRYSNVYGVGENHKSHYKSMVSKIINNIFNDEKVTLFKYGEQKRDFIYIKDIVELNVKAAESGVGGVFNGGSGQARSFNEIVSIVDRNLNKKSVIDYIDNPYEKTYQNLTLCDMSLTKDKLNFEPKWSLEEGISDLIKQIK